MDDVPDAHSRPGAPAEGVPSAGASPAGDPAAGDPASDRTAVAAAAPSSLGKQLRGDLPCVVCRYNLKGISIRSACPECGTAVRATILAMVDPLAKELRRIHHPRLIAGALALWGLCAFLATLGTWFRYLPGVGEYNWRLFVCVAGAFSGLGAIAFVRPHAGIRPIASLAALAGVLLHVPLVFIAWDLTGPRWIVRPFSFPPKSVEPESARLLMRLAFDGLLALMLSLLRPNARLLVARSLALRMGRVDRQTILAVVVAVVAVAIGDTLMLVAPQFLGVIGDTVRMAGIILVVAGSALITLGAVGIMVDSFRIARAIVVPTPSLATLIHGPSSDAAVRGPGR